MPTFRISEDNANELLDLEFQNGMWIVPVDADPTDDGSAGVIDGVARVYVNAGGWSAAANKQLHNVDGIDFTDMPECSIWGFAAFGSEEGSDFKRSCPRMTGSPLELDPLAVTAGDTVTIPAEECVFRFENIEV